ncbi:MAG: sigma 54-interacting transcriptional regulator [Polyangiales bacterium]
MWVKLGVPEGGLPDVVVLREGDVALVGREPDEASVDVPVTTVRVVPSALVSGSHALLWVDGDALHVRDLGSKNGTFLKVERGATATTRGGDNAEVLLASPRVTPRAPLRDVAFTPGDLAAFVEALRGAVQQWLIERGYSVTVRVARAEPDVVAVASNDDEFSVPVSEGITLRVIDDDDGRTRLRWDGVKAELFAGVYEQTARWRACQGARSEGPMALASPRAERALREVLDAAKARAPLVLVGETGSGKTSLAAMYAGRDAGRGRRGRTGGAPFVTVHCSHLDAPLAHATLFGALRGSYTSAERTQLGAVRHADGGVLFLDDIDALPLETQAKLLRFLDDGEYVPLGHSARDPLVADVRVVGGSARRPARRGPREDLPRGPAGACTWARWCTCRRCARRPEDIERILQQSPGEASPPTADEPQHARSVYARLSPGALDFLLRQYTWGGNFREYLRLRPRVATERPSDGAIEGASSVPVLSGDLAGAPTPALERPDAQGRFDAALAESLAWWRAVEGEAPERFDELEALLRGPTSSRPSSPTPSTSPTRPSAPTSSTATAGTAWGATSPRSSASSTTTSRCARACGVSRRANGDPAR